MATGDVPDYAQQVTPSPPQPATPTYMYAPIVASVAGATTIVAAVVGKQIVVMGYVLIANAAVNTKWQSHTGAVDLTGLVYLAANGGAVAPFSEGGWFQTAAGSALDLNLSGAFAVGGHIVYQLV